MESKEAGKQEQRRAFKSQQTRADDLWACFPHSARRRRKAEAKEQAGGVAKSGSGGGGKGSIWSKAMTPGAAWTKDTFPEYPDVGGLLVLASASVRLWCFV